MSDPHAVGRRDFVLAVTALLGSIMGAVIGLPAIGYLISPATKMKKSEAWIPLGPLENFPEGIPTLFNFVRPTINGWEKSTNSYGLFVIRSAGGEVKALSNMCTHLSCRVSWHEENQEYVCPCHDAKFDINGTVTGGPPPRPLDAFETKIEDNNLFILFKES